MNLPQPSGVLPVDKPAGMTSHDVVSRARGAFSTRRIGHTGTLDPFATGLLLLCVGRATRIAEYLSALPKTYDAVACLGTETDTDDLTGTTTVTSDTWRNIAPSEIREAFLSQQGSFTQIPPDYSAGKVEGEPLYRRARRGERVQARPRAVFVEWLRVLEVRPPEVRFQVRCSAGTYVRAIARDVGRTLGTGAHLTDLRRTAIGSLTLALSLELDEIRSEEAVAKAWITPADALAHLPSLSVSSQVAQRLEQGNRAPLPGAADSDEPLVVLVDNVLVAICLVRNAELVPTKVFPR